MKKIILMPLLLLAAIQLKAQQQMLFKPMFLPNTTYAMSKQMKMDMTMNMPAGMAPAGAPQGMAMVTTTSTISVATTGGRDKNNMIPIKFNVKTGDVKMTMNGQDMPLGALPNTALELYGKYTPDGKLQVDSVAGQKITDSLRVTMTRLLETIQNGVKFPDHMIKVGESFTQDMPFAIPLPGGASGNTTTVKVTYKLLSIANNIAAFELAENVDVNMDQAIQGQNLKMKMSGIGNGTLNYDITKQFFTNMSSNINLSLDIDLGGMAMTGKGMVSTVDKVEIGAK